MSDALSWKLQPLVMLLLYCSLAGLLTAQTSEAPHANMPGMQMPGMNMGEMNAAGMFLVDQMSGTAQNPQAWPMPMLMNSIGNWNVMFMGEAFLDDTQQSGPRGGGKLYSTNWFMADLAHKVGAKGALQFQLMLSLEPATITGRRYPLLFQTGETAFGKPIVDGQHPHNFVMSLGVQYAIALNENTILELYFAPVGDPALGPIAYPHRASAMELPQAPISHHLEDSTHISDEVVTAGIVYKKIKLEASGFYGTEPGENRWTIQTGPVNSWSTRLWYFPGSHWAAQISTGYLAHPEVLEPGDQNRTTASVEYSKPMRGSAWSSTAIWGRVHKNYTKRNLDAYTAESALPIGNKNFITGRIDLADKDELFAAEAGLDDFVNRFYGSTFRIGAYTFGYTRDISLLKNVETGLGANVETYSLPGAIRPYYGEHPISGNVFLRLRLKPHSDK